MFFMYINVLHFKCWMDICWMDTLYIGVSHLIQRSNGYQTKVIKGYQTFVKL